MKQKQKNTRRLVVDLEEDTYRKLKIKSAKTFVPMYKIIQEALKQNL